MISLLDTGYSKTIVRRDLVVEEQWLEGESTIIQCAHGDAITGCSKTIVQRDLVVEEQ